MVLLVNIQTYSARVDLSSSAGNSIAQAAIFHAPRSLSRFREIFKGKLFITKHHLVLKLVVRLCKKIRQLIKNTR